MGLFNWLRVKTMNKLIDFALKALLENSFVKPFLGKHKRVIGFLITVIGLLITELPKHFPEATWIDGVNGYYVLISGVILSGIGHVHAQSKERRRIK